MSFAKKSITTQLLPLQRASWWSCGGGHATKWRSSTAVGNFNFNNNHHRSFSSSQPKTKQQPTTTIPTVSQTLSRDTETFSSRRLPDLFSLRGKVTVFTGGGRGIGLTMARAAAELGSHVALVDVLPQVADDLSRWKAELGIEARYYRADVTKMEDIERAMEGIKRDFGRVDGCVTAAAIVYDKPFEEHGWDECSRMLDINIMGSYFTAQCAAKAMLSSPSSSSTTTTEKCSSNINSSSTSGKSIIFISSSSAHIVTPSRRMSMYSATKGAMDALTKNLAAELGPRGIRVNSISPGFIATEMVMDVASRDEELWRSFNDGNPMRRIGLRSEVKGVVGYLLSDAASFTTGADYKVDGGMAAGRI